MTKPADNTEQRSPWPHRMAWVICCATFPLVWIGGLITTTDAGMAVPDWPGTYGYNLFLYPWSTWFFGPWDLFVEHGHRLFASGVGLLTIALLVVVFRTDDRAWLRSLAVAALLLVIGQGVLGGLRVVFNERMLAFAHGATGPLFFALTAVIVVMTAPAGPPRSGSRWWWLLPALVYNQVILGAAMRHAPEASSFATFSQHVLTHVGGAFVVLAAVLGVFAFALAKPVGRARRVLAWLMAAAVGAQIALGVATWVAKYRLPAWAQQGVAADIWEAVVGSGTMAPSVAEGWAETHVVTAHSAIGSLLLALAAAWAVASRPAPPSTLAETDAP